MPFREVNKTQQTFHGTNNDSTFTFAFYKVYKQQKKNRFRLRVVTIADFCVNVSAEPHIYFAQDLTNGYAVYSDEATQGSTGLVSNEFCLGVCPRNFYDISANTDTCGVATFAPPEVYMDEISTSPFTIKFREVGTATYGTHNVGLLVVFEITEIEDY
jgi:hypothetical protein